MVIRTSRRRFVASAASLTALLAAGRELDRALWPVTDRICARLGTTREELIAAAPPVRPAPPAAPAPPADETTPGKP